MNLRSSAGGLATRSLASIGRDGIVLVGNPGPEHVGSHFRNAAKALDLPLELCNSDLAFRAHPALAKVNWWLRSHRPANLRQFSREVRKTCVESNAEYLLTTGLAPLDAETLESIGCAGTFRMNFLTDDPWNSQHKASWFLRALPHYDVVFTPRKANVGDLNRLGCARVEYLPFAYAPEIHFPDPPATEEDKRYSADVFFAGGADAERVQQLTALMGAGMDVALYGGYWSRYPETRASARGHATHEVLRKASRGARIALCLVRRANRDGHAMRTYELAAMGACILAEDTEEHREILGPDGVSAVYFLSAPDMIAKAREMLHDCNWRDRLAMEARARICSGGNAYSDRLETMLRLAKESERMARQLA